MFSFFADKNFVRLSVDTGFTYTYKIIKKQNSQLLDNTNIIISFFYECQSELHAKCLAEHLNKKFRRRVRSTREFEYDQGYSHGKHKRKFKLDHNTCLEDY